MYLNYTDLIRESEDEIARLERQYRNGPVAARLKMLRLLKSGAYRSRRALSQVLGYGERQLQRWFNTYRKGGIQALLLRDRPSGRGEAITPEAWAAPRVRDESGKHRYLERRPALSLGVLLDPLHDRRFE